MTVFNKILRILISLPLVFAMILIVIVNARLSHERQVTIEGADTIQYELLKELRGLKKNLTNNADLQMQEIYPEGYVFLNAVYALAWSSFLSDKAHQKYDAPRPPKLLAQVGRIP